MEEGGEIRACCNECNKDHLATAQDSLHIREKGNNRWLVCGFNGFGQLKFGNNRKIIPFEEMETPFANYANDLVACSWNCLALANGCSLYLRGFILNSPNTIKSVKTKVPIKYLDICDKYCLVLLENGQVYKLELGSEIELKEIKFQINLMPIISLQRIVFKNKKEIQEANLQITHIACGNNITAAVSTTNAIFNGTTQIHQFPKHEHTKQLKCGFEHVLLLTKNGDIYAWGHGLRGQLGLEILRMEEIPTIIEALAGIKIIYVAAGGWHSAAISAFRDVYTWGYNSNGQLGLRLYKTTTEILKEPSMYPLPQLIDLETCQHCKNSNDTEIPCYPTKIAAGARHTVLQMSCGSINAAGWNFYGQLGLIQSQQYCDSFNSVYKLKEPINKQIVCGNWCTLLKKSD